jgi:hypothetical protein
MVTQKMAVSWTVLDTREIRFLKYPKWFVNLRERSNLRRRIAHRMIKRELSYGDFWLRKRAVLLGTMTYKQYLGLSTMRRRLLVPGDFVKGLITGHRRVGWVVMMERKRIFPWRSFEILFGADYIDVHTSSWQHKYRGRTRSIEPYYKVTRPSHIFTRFIPQRFAQANGAEIPFKVLAF